MIDRPLRVCALYPELMNIYADRGNLLITPSTLGETLADEYDIYYLGGGQDADQRRCAADLVSHKSDALRSAAARDAVVLGVCGGYQLLGHSYEIGEEHVEGVGLLDVVTVRADGPRLIGNIAIALDEAVIVGFENHAGRTRLGAGQEPLGRVIRGHGNDGNSGFEGARSGNVIGTYVHGPLLPKNSWLCDWLIAQALGVEVGDLALLDDAFEDAAHANALHAAGL
jgi:CobQ-like glutamine amidotransferase family enzyme